MSEGLGIERTISARRVDEEGTDEDALATIAHNALGFLSAYTAMLAGDESERGNVYLWLGVLAGTLDQTRRMSWAVRTAEKAIELHPRHEGEA